MFDPLLEDKDSYCPHCRTIVSTFNKQPYCPSCGWHVDFIQKNAFRYLVFQIIFSLLLFSFLFNEIKNGFGLVWLFVLILIFVMGKTTIEWLRIPSAEYDDIQLNLPKPEATQSPSFERKSHLPLGLIICFLFLVAGVTLLIGSVIELHTMEERLVESKSFSQLLFSFFILVISSIGMTEFYSELTLEKKLVSSSLMSRALVTGAYWTSGKNKKFHICYDFMDMYGKTYSGDVIDSKRKHKIADVIDTVYDPSDPRRNKPVFAFEYYQSRLDITS